MQGDKKHQSISVNHQKGVLRSNIPDAQPSQDPISILHSTIESLMRVLGHIWHSMHPKQMNHICDSTHSRSHCILIWHFQLAQGLPTL